MITSYDHLTRNADSPKRTGVSLAQDSFKVIPSTSGARACSKKVSGQIVDQSIRQIVTASMGRRADTSTSGVVNSTDKRPKIT